MRKMTEYEADKAYEEMINECHQIINIGGLEYEAGRVLRVVDPIAFRCGVIEWADGEGIEIEFSKLGRLAIAGCSTVQTAKV